MTADVEALKDELVTACSTMAKAAQAAALSAMATAGVVSKQEFNVLAPGVAYPNRNLIDAGSLASQAQQTTQAVYSCADALAKLQTAFPTPDPPPPTEPAP